MSKSPTLPGILEPFNARALSAAANIESAARTDAVRCRPAAADPSPPDAVLHATELVENRIEARHATRLEQIHAITEQIDALPDPRLDGNIKKIAGMVEALTMTVFTDTEPATRKAVAGVRTTRAFYDAWCDERGIAAAADYPASKLNHYAPIIVADLAEAGATAGMYLNATPDGFVGATTIALSVTALNCGIGILTGLFPIRYLRSASATLRVLSLIGIVIATASVFLLNLAAANFRELATIAGDAFDQAQVAKHMWSSPLDLSFPSLALLGMGIANALFACVKGYRSTDPIPGHEKHHRKLQDDEDELEDVKAMIRGRLDGIGNHELVSARDKPQAYAAELQAIRRAHVSLCQLKTRHQALDGADLSALAGAIHKYRSVNEHVRSDNVVPTFNVDLDALRKPDTPIETLGADIEVATERHLEHSAQWLTYVDGLFRLIEDAKELTAEIMQQIEHASGTATAVPKLAELRAQFAAFNANANAEIANA